jgi:hypothetical protein
VRRRYQAIFEKVVLDLNFFSGSVTSQNEFTYAGAPYTPKPTMNFVNLGATLVY